MAASFSGVLVVGLTGGIGAGKSSVADRLESRGALVIDADRITRQLQEPGEPVFRAMVDRFGPGIVGTDGALDRKVVADLVFSDPRARRDLEAIVHPEVARVMAEQMAEAVGTEQIVVLDIPLLVESEGRGDMAGVIVVDCSLDAALRRLVEHRGFSPDDARARMANQATRQERLDRADFVITNEGSLEELELEVDRCWRWIQSLLRGTPGPR